MQRQILIYVPTLFFSHIRNRTAIKQYLSMKKDKTFKTITKMHRLNKKFIAISNFSFPWFIKIFFLHNFKSHNKSLSITITPNFHSSFHYRFFGIKYIFCISLSLENNQHKSIGVKQQCSIAALKQKRKNEQLGERRKVTSSV